jgi:hypothetical protein
MTACTCRNQKAIKPLHADQDDMARAIAYHELYALLSAKKVMVQVAVEIRGFFGCLQCSTLASATYLVGHEDAGRTTNDNTTSCLSCVARYSSRLSHGTRPVLLLIKAESCYL